MSEAIKLIVTGYLTLKDRGAIENLWAHRQRLKKQLQDQPNGAGLRVLGQATHQLDEELSVIEAALASFDSSATRGRQPGVNRSSLPN